MRVCFLIATKASGLGGHYRSLLAMAEALSAECECSIINIGRAPSPVLRQVEVPTYFVPFHARDMCKPTRHIFNVLGKIRPNVLNSYDVASLAFARIARMRFRLPVVHTKCGGANPRRFFPRADAYVLYSMENAEYFRSHPKLQKIPTVVIPNRVKSFECQPQRVAEVAKQFSSGTTRILRVCRLSSSHEWSIIQCVNLVRQLNRDGHACELLVVGAADDMGTYERIQGLVGDDVHLITEPSVVANAADAIDAADLVVGTGRGFMEAACRRRVLLTPVRGAAYPLLVTDGNLASVARTNFSGRDLAKGHDEAANYALVVEAVENPARREQLRQLAGRWFDESFDVEHGATEYAEFLGSARRQGGVHPLDFLLNAYKCYLGHQKDAIRARRAVRARSRQNSEGA